MATRLVNARVPLVCREWGRHLLGAEHWVVVLDSLARGRGGRGGAGVEDRAPLVRTESPEFGELGAAFGLLEQTGAKRFAASPWGDESGASDVRRWLRTRCRGGWAVRGSAEEVSSFEGHSRALVVGQEMLGTAQGKFPACVHGRLVASVLRPVLLADVDLAMEDAR